MTLHYPSKADFPVAGNKDVYYVDDSNAFIYTYSRNQYELAPLKAGIEVPQNPHAWDPPPPPQYTLTFDAQGGTPEPVPVTAVAGTLIPEPAAPTLTGKTLDGWFDQATGGTLIVWPLAMPAVDTTIYAQWS